MNRLGNCINQFIQTIPVDDDMPNELAHTLQSIYRDRTMELTQRSIEEWLLRVSQTYGVDCEWLEGDWDQYNQHVDGKRKVVEEYCNDAQLDDDHDDHDDQDPDQDEMDMDGACPRKKMCLTFATLPKDKSDTEKKRMVKIVTRWNTEVGRFVHADTGMVFVSKQEPKVFANWNGEQIVRLSSDDLEVCRLYRFQVATERFDEEIMPRVHEAAESSFALDQS